MCKKPIKFLDRIPFNEDEIIGLNKARLDFTSKGYLRSQLSPFKNINIVINANDYVTVKITNNTYGEEWLLQKDFYIKNEKESIDYVLIHVKRDSNIHTQRRYENVREVLRAIVDHTYCNDKFFKAMINENDTNYMSQIVENDKLLKKKSKKSNSQSWLYYQQNQIVNI